MKAIKENRIGMFEIYRNDILANPQDVRSILNLVLIVNVEHTFETIKYTGYCNSFEKVMSGMIPKFYTFEVEGGEVTLL